LQQKAQHHRRVLCVVPAQGEVAVSCLATRGIVHAPGQSKAIHALVGELNAASPCLNRHLEQRVGGEGL
jgi:hypothetical protein